MISGKNIVLKADNKIILDGVDFDVQAQRITFFLGRSGAGKTSLMRCVANLNPDYEGSLTFNRQEIKTFSAQQRARHIGFVAQSFNLFPHMTALENCSHPLQKVLGMDAKEADASAAATLERLHIADLGASYPKNLSGGQQQRVAIARALCMKPEVLIMDEPTSALDPASTQSLVDLIAELHEQGLTLCISSHDVPFVKSMLDRAYLLEAGKVVEVYDQQLEGAGAGEKIKEFLG